MLLTRGGRRPSVFCATMAESLALRFVFVAAKLQLRLEFVSPTQAQLLCFKPTLFSASLLQYSREKNSVILQVDSRETNSVLFSQDDICIVK